MLVSVPAPFLAETYSGRQQEDAILNRALPYGLPQFVLETTRDIAREAGMLRYRARTQEKTIDAIIVSMATLYPGSIILTSDPDDVNRLAAQCAGVRHYVRSVNSAVARACNRESIEEGV